MRGPRLPIKLCCRFRSENGHHVWWEEGHDGAWGLDRAADGMQTALRKSGQLHNLWSAWRRTHRSTAFRWKCSVRKPRRSCRRRAMYRWNSVNWLKEFPTYVGITKHCMNLCFSNRPSTVLSLCAEMSMVNSTTSWSSLKLEVRLYSLRSNRYMSNIKCGGLKQLLLEWVPQASPPIQTSCSWGTMWIVGTTVLKLSRF